MPHPLPLSKNRFLINSSHAQITKHARFSDPLIWLVYLCFTWLYAMDLLLNYGLPSHFTPWLIKGKMCVSAAAVVFTPVAACESHPLWFTIFKPVHECCEVSLCQENPQQMQSVLVSLRMLCLVLKFHCVSVSVCRLSPPTPLFTDVGIKQSFIFPIRIFTFYRCFGVLLLNWVSAFNTLLFGTVKCAWENI